MSAPQRLPARSAGARAYLMARPPWKRAALLVLWGGAALAASLVLYILILIPLTPGIKDLKQARAAKASAILSADGNQLATFEEGLHERVKLDQISPFVLQALIATEDHRFYDHSGIDYRRTLSSVAHTLGGDPQGGSTITQQLARNMFPEEIGRSRSINRKLKEMITAVKIEATYSKTEILETYLNTVPFLYNTFGIETAAQTYFDKPTAKLDILEAATLVGMLKGTSYYNPVSRPERSVERRNVVLGQMLKHGIIDEKRFQVLKKRPLRLHFTRQSERTASDSHFTSYVRKWLIQWADENDYNLQLDGLVVHTTLDYTLQTAATRAVDRQGAALQMVADVEWAQADSGSSSSIGSYAEACTTASPRSTTSGAPRVAWSMPSSAKAPNTRRRSTAARRRRPPSSACAPTAPSWPSCAAPRRVWKRASWRSIRPAAKCGPGSAAATSRKTSSTTSRKPRASPVRPSSPSSTGPRWRKAFRPSAPTPMPSWRSRLEGRHPVAPDRHDRRQRHEMTLREGLIMSKNTITAQVMQDVGLPNIVKLARDLGIRDSKLDPVPSLALGTSPVTLLEMVTAYSTIASQGEYRKPVFIKRITDRQGNTIAEFRQGHAAARHDERSGRDPDRHHARRDQPRHRDRDPLSLRHRRRRGLSKTGTTQNNTDGWFIMMHPNLVAWRLGGFQRQPRDDAQQLLGPGRSQRDPGGGRLLQVGARQRQDQCRRHLPGRGAPGAAATQEEPEDVLEQGGDMHQDGVPVPEAPPEEVIEDESEGEPKPGDSAPQPEPQPMPQPRPERGERADPVQN
ncbi:penicillin-binding protein [Massilia sp. H-1]|nr:penicillin-binding protein [Massilia sp. H-1]